MTTESRLTPKGMGIGLQEKFGLACQPSKASWFPTVSCHNSSVNEVYLQKWKLACYPFVALSTGESLSLVCDRLRSRIEIPCENLSVKKGSLLGSPRRAQ